jgi:hypothetical protein
VPAGFTECGLGRLRVNDMAREPGEEPQGSSTLVTSRATRVECVSMLPLTPDATICEHPRGMRQAKTLILRSSRVRMIDCYCGVTCMRYEAVATSAPAKLWLIGDLWDTRCIVSTSTSIGRRWASAHRAPSSAGSPRAREQGWTQRRRRPKCGRRDPDMVAMTTYR